MKKKNKWISLIIIVAIVIGVLLITLLKAKGGKTTLSVETEPIQLGSLSSTITATGTIEPISSVEVGTEVSGTISAIYVDYNSIVTKGQVLAELDKTVLESELKSQQTNLASAKNEMDYQKKNYDRIKALYEKGTVSQIDFESIEYTYTNAKLTYEKVKLQVVTAQKNLSYTTIKSPINGVVLSKAVEVGQTVAASFSTPTLFTIAEDLTKMQVVVNIDEADIGQVKEGQNATFTVDAFPDDIFHGKVTQVRLEAQTTSNVVTYSVVVEAPNPDLKLMPGLTASVSVFTMERDSILILPAKATRLNIDPTLIAKYADRFDQTNQMPMGKNRPQLTEAQKKEMMNRAPSGNPNMGKEFNPSQSSNANSNMKMVWIQQSDKKLHPAMVKIGQSNGTQFEIIDGLKAGDQVVTSIKEVALKEQKEQEKTSAQSPFMPGPRNNKKSK